MRRQRALDSEARWESRGGKHWVELFVNPDASEPHRRAFYRGEGCGGNLGAMTAEAAVTHMQGRVDSGEFLPDAAKMPMRRVW